jgi:hypothetical protein
MQHRKCRLGAGGIAIDRRDESAFTREQQRAGTPDAGASAADDGHPSRKSHP